MWSILNEFTKNSLLLFLSAPIQAGLILFEMLFSRLQGHVYYKTKDTITNIYLMLLNLGLDRLLILTLTVPVLEYFRKFQFVKIDNLWLYWCVLLIAEDFLFYWQHYFDHKVRLLWAVHVTHHTSQEFNLTVGFRSSVLQPLYRFIYFIPLSLMGFESLDIMFMYSLTQIYGILMHTRYTRNWGWLEYLLVTPSHHRVHHASNEKYLDKNMGMVFIIWDRFFGTFQKELDSEEYEPIRFGITKEITNPGPLQIIFHEWKELINDYVRQKEWRDKLNILFAPPDWINTRNKKS